MEKDKISQLEKITSYLNKEIKEIEERQQQISEEKKYLLERIKTVKIKKKELKDYKDMIEQIEHNDIYLKQQISMIMDIKSNFIALSKKYKKQIKKS